MRHYDITIVGAGLVGLATAYRLKQQQPGLRIAVLEKEAELAPHQSSHNSGVIHSGIYYKPGSLRALNCQRGYTQLVNFCKEYGVSYELCGKLIAAVTESERGMLENIFQRGLANGLTGIRKISREEALETEPYLDCREAILVPQTGIVDFPGVAKVLASLITAAGGEILLNNQVLKITGGKPDWVITTARSEMSTTQLINCGGLYADRLAQMSGQQSDIQIVPFRGEYYQLKKEKEYLVRHLIYPVPNPAFPFLGVHFTRMVHGGIEAGPNAVLAFKREGYNRWQLDVAELWEVLRYKGFHQLAAKNWKFGLEEMKRSYFKNSFVKALQRLVPTLQAQDVVPDRSGVRAMALDNAGNVVDDFMILQNNNVINVLNAPSPAATSCLSIGESIAGLVINH